MTILKVAGIIKNPKLETSESIREYCLKNNDPYDILWMPDTKEHLDTVINRYPGVPTVLIYDQQYNVLQNAHGERCQKMLIEFFSDSTKHQYKKVNDSSYTFLKELSKPVDIKKTTGTYDYIVVYSWVKWAPKLTKDLFARLDAVKKSKKYKVCFISLNKDWQKGMYEKVPKLSKKVTNSGSASAPHK